MHPVLKTIDYVKTKSIFLPKISCQVKTNSFEMNINKGWKYVYECRNNFRASTYQREISLWTYYSLHGCVTRKELI